jgi:hypothetical protein
MYPIEMTGQKHSSQIIGAGYDKASAILTAPLPALAHPAIR